MPVAAPHPRDPVIVTAVRTPVGRAHKGRLKDTRPDDLAAAIIRAALVRTPGLEAGQIDDVLLGNAHPEGEAGYNFARLAAQLAELPVDVAAFRHRPGCAGRVCVGFAPQGRAGPPGRQVRRAGGATTRVQDADGVWHEVVVTHDEGPREDTSLEALAELPTVFADDEVATVTAGNSSPLNDGAAMTVVMSREQAAAQGITPLVRFVQAAAVGVPPEIMGIGPVPAIRALLTKTGMTITDVDLVEINEAFASQVYYCQQELGIPDEKLNVNGGAIAIGHPLGATGARIAADLFAEMRRSGKELGIISMCVGGGQGMAGLFQLI